MHAKRVLYARDGWEVVATFEETGWTLLLDECPFSAEAVLEGSEVLLESEGWSVSVMLGETAPLPGEPPPSIVVRRGKTGVPLPRHGD